MTPYQEYASFIEDQMNDMHTKHLETNGIPQKMQSSLTNTQNETHHLQMKLEQMYDENKNQNLQMQLDESYETMSSLQDEIQHLENIQSKQLPNRNDIIESIKIKHHMELETIIQCNANLERRLQNLNDFMEREMNEKQIIQKLEHQILVEQKQFDNEIKSLEQQQMQLRKNLQMDMEYKIQDTRQSLIAISEEKMLGPTKGTIMESEQMRYELAYQSRESKKMESFMKEKECYQKKMIVSNVESEKKERCCALRIHEYKQSTKTIDSLINEKSKENEDQVAAITNNHAENEKESTNELTNDDHHFINYHQSLVKLLKVKKSNLYLSQTPLLQLLYSTCHEILKPYFKPIIQSQKDDTEIHKKMNIEDTIAKMDNETNTQTKLDTLSNTKKKELCDLILIKLYKNSMKKHSNITLHPSSSAFVALKTFLDCDNNLFCIDRKC